MSLLNKTFKVNTEETKKPKRNPKLLKELKKRKKYYLSKDELQARKQYLEELKFRIKENE